MYVLAIPVQNSESIGCLLCIGMVHSCGLVWTRMFPGMYEAWLLLTLPLVKVRTEYRTGLCCFVDSLLRFRSCFYTFIWHKFNLIISFRSCIFIPHFIMDSITYSCWDFTQYMIVKGSLSRCLDCLTKAKATMQALVFSLCTLKPLIVIHSKLLVCLKTL